MNAKTQKRDASASRFFVPTPHCGVFIVEFRLIELFVVAQTEGAVKNNQTKTEDLCREVLR